MRRLKLFRMGSHQVIRIPREFEIAEDSVVIRKEGHRLILEPISPKAPSLSALLATWEPIDEDMPEMDDPPPEPVEL